MTQQIVHFYFKPAVRLFLGGLLLTTLLCSGPAFGGALDGTSLRNAMQNKQRISVIVELDAAAKTLRKMSGRHDQVQQRAFKSQLKEAKKAFKEKKKTKKNVKLKREFKHLPYLVYDVDAQGLDELLNDPSVTVRQNRVGHASLTQSLKRVYPSQKWSPYHGNNEWTVAVLDTGVNKNHPMLAGKVVSEACYSSNIPPDVGEPDTEVTSLCPGGVTASTASGSGLDCNTSIEGCGHGTQMAGVIAGNTTGRLGVAKDAKIIAIKVFSETENFTLCSSSSCVVVYEDDVMAGLDRVYALRNAHKIAAVNLSINFGTFGNGGFCDSDPLKPSIDLLRSAGIPTIVSAGNDSETQDLSSPSCISTAIAVGATFDNNDTIWPDSNRSQDMDIFAPGVNIATAFGASGYKNVTGTSAAAAHVSGAWAAARHAWPSASVTQLKNRINSKGPVVFTQSGKSKRRLDVRAILDSIDPGSQINPTAFLPAVNLLLLLDDD